ncbi:hypothetical protein KIPE111705_05740 [Kibdelosporangium persicum]|uniref:hypothetical protein n=1 Tax=Kibdelosporangium persicum TaxID=2698649 RepID=UPI001567C291|nr:hypothetical protein [Kibdelosporangium persicum]
MRLGLEFQQVAASLIDAPVLTLSGLIGVVYVVLIAAASLTAILTGKKDRRAAALKVLRMLLRRRGRG